MSSLPSTLSDPWVNLLSTLSIAGKTGQGAQATSALRRKDHKFEVSRVDIKSSRASLGYTVGTYLQKGKKKKARCFRLLIPAFRTSR